MTIPQRVALICAATIASAAVAQPTEHAAPASAHQHQHQHQHQHHHAEHHGRHGQQGQQGQQGPHGRHGDAHRNGQPAAGTAAPAASAQGHGHRRHETPAPAAARSGDPLDPAAAVPRLEYRSALRGYRPLADTPPGDWRALNEQVHRVGGWRTYLRQAHAPEPPAAEASAPPPAPATPAAPSSHDHGSKP